MLGSLCLQVGAILATEAIKLVTGIGEPLLGRVLVIDALRGRTDEVPLRPSAAAPLASQARVAPIAARRRSPTALAAQSARRDAPRRPRAARDGDRRDPRRRHDPARRGPRRPRARRRRARSSWSARSARARCARRGRCSTAGIEASVLTGGMDAWDAASRPRVSA